MPVTTEKRGDKIRIVEADSGKYARAVDGTFADEGGYADTPPGRCRAHERAQAINAALNTETGRWLDIPHVLRTPPR